jgi:hypothetical protein
MLTAQAQVATARPSRYLVQLCKHFTHNGRHLPPHPGTDRGDEHASPEPQAHVEWSGTRGTVDFGWSRCTMQVTGHTLTLRAEADNEENLQRVQELVAEHLNRFASRDRPEMKWQRQEAAAVHSGGDSPTTHPLAPGTVARRTRRQTILLTAAGALIVAVHLGLGRAALESAPWTGWAANLILAAVLLKVTAIGFLAARRRRGRGSPVGRSRPRAFGLAAHVASSAGHLGTVAGFLRAGRRSNQVIQEPMARSEARVPTPRGERYAKQLCSHAARIAPHAQWNPPEGMIEFPDAMGTCRITAEPEHLLLTLEATGSANLARLQQIVGGNIERFAHREGLKAEWVQD